MMEGIAVTADGAVFRGTSVGADGITTGEIVFNTSMSGYQEIFSDPSYAGQVVVMTTPHIGNYGVTGLDEQADRSWVNGVIVRAMARRESNWRSEGSLAEYFRDKNLVALSQVDTRRLTRHIREHGAQPIAVGVGASEAELITLAAETSPMTGQDLASGVSTEVSYDVAAQGVAQGLVVAVDLGMKSDIVAHLSLQGYDVRVVPASTKAAEIMALEPAGVFVSNGPGDPEPLVGPVQTVRDLLGNVPLFGICLGNQILGLALGGRTFKLPFGHHGGNHPVQRLADGRVEITAQNHGFAVDLWSMASGSPPDYQSGLVQPSALPELMQTDFGEAVPTHQNLNDGTCEGMRCLDVPAFSVQYHPEAAPGPRDSLGLFSEFVALMGGEARA